MKTLSLEIKKTFFETKEQYMQMKEAWAKKKVHNRAQHLLYAIFRGQDWNKAFTPITNTNKIMNGHVPYNEGVYHAKEDLFVFGKRYIGTELGEQKRNWILSCFGDTINENMVVRALEYFTGNRLEPYRFKEESYDRKSAMGD